jgi:hypothetical protein
MGTSPQNSPQLTGWTRDQKIQLALAIIAAITLIGWIVTIFYSSAQFQAATTKPQLEGAYSVQSGGRNDADAVAKSMLDEILKQASQASQQTPTTSYSDLLANILPYSKDIQASPSTVTVSIHNDGNSPATNIAFLISGTGKISTIQVDSLSKWQTTDGGINQNKVKGLIDRVSTDETIKITVEFAPVGTTDRAVWDIEQTPSLADGTVPDTQLPINFSNGLTFSINPNYPSPENKVRVEIASDQTPTRDLLEEKPRVMQASTCSTTTAPMTQ